MTPTIAGYLGELEQQLRRRRAPRRRLLREVEHHLRDSVEELVAGGVATADAEVEALRRFGSAANVAARFAAAAASTTAHRAVDLAALALVAYLACFLLFASTAPATVRDFPQGAPSFFAIQLAVVALLVAFVRSRRWRAQVSAPLAELTFMTRALTIALGALLAAGGAEALLALLRPAGVVVWDAARWLTLGFAAGGLLVVAASIAGARAAAQAAAVDALPAHRQCDRRGAELLFNDLVTLTARLPISFAPRVGALHPLRHPWRVVCLVAALAFAAVSGAQLIAGSFQPSITAGALLLGLLEAGAIVGCFAVFGRFLGLRDEPSALRESS